MPVTSPLQAAHDQAGAETIVCTVAAPRQVAMVGVYTGAELQTRSSRPGAYDAMRLPSLVNGRQRVPGARAEMPTAYVPPAPSPITARAPVAISDADHVPRTFFAPCPAPAKSGKQHRERPQPRTMVYTPRPGSVPGRVIQALRELPPSTSFSAREIEEKFGLPREQFYGSFQLPIAKGALLFVRRASGNRERVVALPGWPTGVTSPTQRLDEDDDVVDDAEQMSAQYELNLREAELGLLTRYIAVLQLRRQLFDAARLFPFPPLTEPPRLTDAA